jgi:hypothetical protein
MAPVFEALAVYFTDTLALTFGKHVSSLSLTAHGSQLKSILGSPPREGNGVSKRACLVLSRSNRRLWAGVGVTTPCE